MVFILYYMMFFNMYNVCYVLWWMLIFKVKEGIIVFLLKIVWE